MSFEGTPIEEFVATLVEQIAARARGKKAVLTVGIDGPTAAGKTILPRACATLLEAKGLGVGIFQLDWTLRSRVERERDVVNLCSKAMPFHM